MERQFGSSFRRPTSQINQGPVFAYICLPRNGLSSSHSIGLSYQSFGPIGCYQFGLNMGYSNNG